MSGTHKNPEHYRSVMPYLILEDADRLIIFATAVFAADERMRHTDDNGRVIRAEITIGDGTIMVDQSSADWDPQPAGLYIAVSLADATRKKALEAGAATVMELSDESYGPTGGIKDPTGNTWWITSAS